MKRPRQLVLGLMVTVAAVACVDNRANAMEFCEHHGALIAAARDGETLTAEQAKDIERDIEKTMRDAEDATRPVRRAARDLLGAYDEIGSLVDDGADPEELAEARHELQQAREDLRAACEPVVGAQS